MDARRLPPRPGACVSSGTHHGAPATRSPRMSSPVNRSASGRRVKFSTTKASKKGARLHMETGLSGNRTRDRSESQSYRPFFVPFGSLLSATAGGRGETHVG